MAIYPFTIANANTGQLLSEILAAGVPCDYITGSATAVDVYTPAVLSAPDEATLNAVVAAHVPQTYTPATGTGGGGDTFVGGACSALGTAGLGVAVAAGAPGSILYTDGAAVQASSRQSITNNQYLATSRMNPPHPSELVAGQGALWFSE